MAVRRGYDKPGLAGSSKANSMETEGGEKSHGEGQCAQESCGSNAPCNSGSDAPCNGMSDPNHNRIYDPKDWPHPEDVSNPGTSEFNEGDKPDTGAVEDDLPLGSEGSKKPVIEANTMVAAVVGHRPPVDKRLQNLKGIPGWNSFSSDTSILTSGSSATSVDALLQEREVDPEQMLMNLGFNFGTDPYSAMMRIPERFLMQKSRANGIHLDDFLEEFPELQHIVMKKKGSRTGAWRAVSRSVSLLGMKALSSMHAPTSTCSSSPIGSPAEPNTNQVKSILHPDNQQALASRGYYDGHNKDISERTKTPLGESKSLPHDASTRRKMYQKTKLRRQWSFVESSSDKENHGSEWESSDNWTSKNMDEFKGRPSTSSIDFSSSVDSSESPMTPETRSRAINGMREQFEANILKSMDEFYFPCHSGGNGGIADMRKSEVQKLMGDPEYSVDSCISPTSSKQNTIEKAPTLEKVATLMPDGNNDENVAPSQEKADKRGKLSKHVRIVVSGDEVDADPANTLEDENTVGNPQFMSKTNGTQMFLNIVNSHIERLSDSGSDHTVVEHQSVSSIDSPRPSLDSQDSSLIKSDSKDIVFTDSLKGNKNICSGERHQVSDVAGPDLERDENDNFPAGPEVKDENIQGDLPRMGSVQSDSSGFGDTDNSADVNPLENELHLLRVASLGSSSESAVTLASSVTTFLGQEHLVSERGTQTSTSEGEKQSNKLSPAAAEKQDVLYPGSNVDHHQRFISWCFIPPLKKTPSPNIAKQSSTTVIDGKDVVLGKTRVSIVLSAKSDNSHGNKGNFLDPHPTVTKTVLETQLSPPFDGQKRHTPSLGQGGRCTSVPEDYPRGDEVESYFPLTRESLSFMQGGANNSNFRVHQMGPSEASGVNLSVADSAEFGSIISDAGDSDYSYSSVADSSASCNNRELMEYKKLVRLINQPITYKGRRRNALHFRPKRPIRDWPTLIKKKRIQEETRLLQHGVQKYKTELQIMETSFLLQYQAAYEDLSQEDREDVEELQCLWAELRQQVLQLEQFLSNRMKAATAGNDFFTFLTSLNMIQKMIDLLKEQIYQQQISVGREDEDDMESNMHYPSPNSTPWWVDYQQHPVSPQMWGMPYAMSPQPQYQGKDLQTSMEEIRGSLLQEMKQELHRSTQQLNLDMQAKDNEIQRLQLQVMMQNISALPRRTRSTYSLSRRRPGRETDV